MNPTILPKGKGEDMQLRKSNTSAKARSTVIDANSIPMIYDRTIQAVDLICRL